MLRQINNNKCGFLPKKATRIAAENGPISRRIAPEVCGAVLVFPTEIQLDDPAHGAESLGNPEHHVRKKQNTSAHREQS